MEVSKLEGKARGWLSLDEIENHHLRAREPFESVSDGAQ